ncbi:uncharacterized protein LOC109835030 [Asparagus officinalis]|uniref:uncharacterized protein LOC109835030 n=1 Tax=Asparagus officinalis TaxID=4686 RepID=UPI00098E7089|nr:uncharacterized protein LOC109835030 [Asparagus officinalis]
MAYFSKKEERPKHIGSIPGHLVINRGREEGSNNNINVLQASNLFDNLTQCITSPAQYTIQGKNYDFGYYLVDGIYPKWPTLVQNISKSKDKKKQYFAMMQEACRKDVERAFGVLQSRFGIIKGPARFWDKQTLHDIMTTCIIMHNMIIEDERDEQEDIVVSTPPSISNVVLSFLLHHQFQMLKT